MGRKPVKKERIDAPLIKEEWVRVLLPVYTRQGLKRFSMNDVAALLNVSKATLYKHFSSREEIIEKSLEIKLQDMASFKEALFSDHMLYIDRYFAAIHLFYNELAGISNEFLSDLKHLYPDIWAKVDFFREYALSQLVAFYKEGLDNHFFNDIDPTILVMNDKWFFDSLSDPDFLLANNLTLQKAFRDYFTLRCYGLFKSGIVKEQLDLRIDEFIQQLQVNN